MAFPGQNPYDNGCNGGTCRRRPYAVHNGGLNVGYVDGHVKWLKGTNVVNDATLWTPERAQSQMLEVTTPLIG